MGQQVGLAAGLFALFGNAVQGIGNGLVGLLPEADGAAGLIQLVNLVVGGPMPLFQLGQRGGRLRLVGGFLFQCRHGRFGGLQIVLMLVQRFPF